jgi:flagellar biosynthesis/type III secretory pathway M-ring protein FliF/YscJ
VLAADLLTLLLVAGILVLIISTTIMAMNFAPRARRRRRRSGHPLSPTAAHTIALAEARAATHRAELATAGVAPGGAAGSLGSGVVAGGGVTGQVIDISDGQLQVRGASREVTVEYAQAIAEHIAETDPQRVAEVISQWIRADSTIDPDLFR